MKERIESKYKELQNLLSQTKKEINSTKSGHKDISKLQQNMNVTLQEELNMISREVDNALNYTSWDNLVIAFFGETNAGKSTIIETFRILFEDNRKKGQDGLIVGDGRPDFTQDYHEYKMSIGGKPFTLIDVPGIEGNEVEFHDSIKQALHKAHCVFYVQGHNKKPDSATAKKIKKYLGDWVNVYSIQNVRGAITNYDEEEERETLLTSSVLKNERLIKETFQKILGNVYKGNITLQALLAMCAKASFSDKRDDLQRNQKKLLNYFGNADEVLRFSQFKTIKQLVEEKSSNFTHEITEANKQKMVSLANKTAHRLEEILSKDDIDVSVIEQKLKEFRRNVQRIFTTTKSNIKYKLPNIVRYNLDDLKGELYDIIDSDPGSIENEGKEKAKEATKTIQREIKKVIKDEMTNASKKIDYKKKELQSLKLKSNYNTNQSIHIDMDFDKALKEFDLSFGEMVGTFMGPVMYASIGASLGSIVPIIGTTAGAIVGGLIGLLKTIFGGDDSKAKAKAKVEIAESISEAEDTCLDELQSLIDEIGLKIDQEKKNLVAEIDKEIRNLARLSGSSSTLKNNIKKYINGINSANYGTI